MKKIKNLASLTLVVLFSIVFQSCLKDYDSYIIENYTFSEVQLPAESFWNGSTGSGGVSFGLTHFSNNYIEEYNYWEGFAFSNVTDIVTHGLENQYSAYVEELSPTSTNVYGISYVYENSATISFYSPANLLSMSVTNSTWAYLSMLNGDANSKKFENGDWFKLTIVGYDNSENIVNSVEFYLADFQSTSNYIIKDWTSINLTPLKNVSKVVFNLSSSDNGEWGMNTPAYVCFDNLRVEFKY
jgi:hypothetical protein